MQTNINDQATRSHAGLARAAFAISFLVVLSGCATFSPDGGMTPVASYAADVMRKDVTVIKNADQAATAVAAVDRLRQHVLTADGAVQVALLNNRRLQAAYNELASAEADMIGESLPPTPTFSISRIAGNGASEIEARAALDILSLATLPARSELASKKFRQAQLRAIEETLRTAAEVRRAYYRAVAAGELVALLGRAEATAKTTAQLAAKLGETGALNKLDQAREQVFYAETSGELATARQQVSSTHERLARLLGFWGRELDFRIPGALPALPARPAALPAIEVQAVSKRVDLQIARIELDVMAKAYGLTNATRFLSMFEMSGIAKRTKDIDGTVTRERGLDASFQIPIFDFGEVRVRQAEAAYMKAVNLLADKAISVRSEAREAYRTYRASYDIASHYQREILPLRKIITEESQLRFSAMQIDVFALLLEARQRIASLRAAIEAKRSYWVADADLTAATLGGGTDGTGADGGSTVQVSEASPAGH